MKKNFIIGFLIGITSLYFLIPYFQNKNFVESICQQNFINIEINKQEFHLKTACSNEEKQKGLMFVESMPENEGMIFVYDKPKPLSFWMKNTYIPLDILYLNKSSNSLIVEDIHNMQPLDLSPIKANKDVQFAIELNQGTANQYNIINNQHIYLK